jgi:hypothetical protein
MFWFALYDCSGESFGLIADCGNPNGRRRLSCEALRSQTGGM